MVIVRSWDRWILLPMGGDMTSESRRGVAQRYEKASFYSSHAIPTSLYQVCCRHPARYDGCSAAGVLAASTASAIGHAALLQSLPCSQCTAVVESAAVANCAAAVCCGLDFTFVTLYGPGDACSGEGMIMYRRKLRVWWTHRQTRHAAPRSQPLLWARPVRVLGGCCGMRWRPSLGGGPQCVQIGAGEVQYACWAV
ncbi:hypothetical protein BC628DRAFT_433616 [Trametes gibbosa]|nr:hypothetical protein BC628DRAFT_433616 [Trametes gibbosa]